MSDDMTDEQLRIVIAEWCGWVWRQKSDGEWSLYCNDVYQDYSDCEKGGFPFWRVPNYPSDLNAVWEVIDKLDDDTYQRYYNSLSDILAAAIQTGRGIRDVSVEHATARQRCIALVKTIEGGR